MIRRLGRADAAAYAALRLEALTAAPQGFGASPEDEAGRDAADVLARNAVFGAEGRAGCSASPGLRAKALRSAATPVSSGASGWCRRRGGRASGSG